MPTKRLTPEQLIELITGGATKRPGVHVHRVGEKGSAADALKDLLGEDHPLVGLLGGAHPLSELFEDPTVKAAAKRGEDQGIALLRERAKAYTAGASVPFNIGDLVVPKPGTCYDQSGLPAMVIAVNAAARPLFGGSGEPGTQTFGMIPNLRVLRLEADGKMAPFWVEAAEFEAYVSVDKR